MGYIYKITNIKNGKVYIGQTTQTIEKRWKRHLKEAGYERSEGRHLYNAMRKDGVTSFVIEAVEEVPDQFLNLAEIRWISHYDSYRNGYNMTKGGDHMPQNHYVSPQIKEKIHELYDAYKTPKFISEELNVPMTKVRDILNIPKGANTNAKDVDHRLIISTYLENKSISKTTSELGINIKTTKSILEKYNIVGKRSLSKKPVICVDKEIDFDSVNEAADWLMLHNYTTAKHKSICSALSRAIKDNRKYLGLTWDFIED